MTVPTSLLQEFRDFLVAQVGWCFPEKRWPDLLRSMTALARERDFSGPESCMRSLMQTSLNRGQVEMLARHLSVGETYFFRDPAVFRILEQEVLPALIEARRHTGKRLRIWSAGCCSGEEAYSIAILVAQLLPDPDGWHIHILGTDIHPGFLKKAGQGVYRDWSFRGLPASFRQRNFAGSGSGDHAILPHIKRLVSFDYLNLASDFYPSLDTGANAMDIILCRNVLMYFEPAQIKQVVRKLHHSLVEGGWLIVSSSELNQQLFADFSAVKLGDATLYRKDVEQPPAAPALRAPRVSASGPRQARKVDSAGAFDKREAPPGRPATPYLTALAHYEDGAYGKAVALLIAGACRGPLELALLARAHANQGLLEAAGNWCEAAIDADKCHPGLRYLQAVILEEQGSMAAALAALKRALYLDQDFVLAHFALGNLYRRLKKPHEAARHFAYAAQLLQAYQAEDILPESEGMPAGRLVEIIRAREGIA